MDASRPRLKGYQGKSVGFLRAKHWAILAHPPGLGKSACSIVAADLPALVICPASLRINWRREVEKWRPDAVDEFLVLSYQDRRLPEIDPGDYRTVIVDEAHYCKNPSAKRTRIVCGLVRRAGRSGRVFCLSGTMPPNRPIETWPLLYAMRITDMSYVDFAWRYAGAYEDERGELVVTGATNVRELKELIRPHYLRYEKSQVLRELPPKTWRVVSLDLPPGQRERSFDLSEVSRMDEEVAFEAMSDVLHQQGLEKVPLVVEHARAAAEEEDGKIILFAWHRDVIHYLAGELRELSPVVVMGGMTDRRKQAAVDVFQRPDSSCRLIVGQMEALGTGHNLTQASRVIFAEASWVPSVLEQASDRAHRIGSAHDHVTCDVLVISGSIDEHQVRRALEKQAVLDELVPLAKPQKWFTSDEACTMLWG